MYRCVTNLCIGPRTLQFSLGLLIHYIILDICSLCAIRSYW